MSNQLKCNVAQPFFKRFISRAKYSSASKHPEWQAPNEKSKWSAHQESRQKVLSDVRFQGIDLQSQPRPLSAMNLLNQQPVTMIAARYAVCNGEDDSLGHPRIYINLDNIGQAHSCGYCGKRFQQIKPENI